MVAPANPMLHDVRASQTKPLPRDLLSRRDCATLPLPWPPTARRSAPDCKRADTAVICVLRPTSAPLGQTLRLIASAFLSSHGETAKDLSKPESPFWLTASGCTEHGCASGRDWPLTSCPMI
jgi:hypothetical protein